MKHRLTLGALALATLPSIAGAQTVPALLGGDSPPPAAQDTGTGRQQANLVRGDAAANAGQQSTQQSAPAGNGPPQQTIPAGWPGMPNAVAPNRALAPREQRNVGMATRWRLRACTPTQRSDGVLEFTMGACEITVVCAVLRVCSISLEPGEQVTDLPDIGDPRWSVQRRVSGSGRTRIIHAMVKPSDAGLDTVLTIPTDRRMIAVRLVSRRDEYMPFVAIRDGATQQRQGWSQEVASAARATAATASPCDARPVVPPSSFRISGSPWSAAPAWKPTQAYVVGTAGGQVTCIDLPADVAATELPALIAYDTAGTERVVSARYQSRRYVVDGVHPRLALVGDNFDKVTIERSRR